MHRQLCGSNNYFYSLLYLQVKLLILTNNYPRKNAMNNGIFIHRQVKALQQLGVECHVLLLHSWFPPMGLHTMHPIWNKGHRLKSVLLQEYEGVRIHAVPMFVKMPSRFFPETHYERAARSVISYVKNNRQLNDADWIYAHFLTDNGYIAAKVKDKLNMKVAAITRGDDVHAWPEQDPSLVGNIRYVFAHANMLLANNKRLAADALKFADKDVPDFKIAYNGIEYTHFTRPVQDAAKVAAMRKQYDIPAHKKILLCVGRAEYLKGWNELIGAMAECRDQLADWVLLAITDNTDGKYGVDVRAKVAAMDVADLVRVHSYVPPGEVKELYWLANAFILPSYNEGLSNAVLEAMSAGLWVIATDVGGHSEIMEHNVSGFLIAPKSKEAVKDSLRYLTANYDARHEEMSRNAVRDMQRLGDYKHNAAILLGYLEACQ